LEVAGLATLGIGVLVLLEPGKSLEALTVITGIYLLFDSILAFAAVLAKDTQNRELAALHGVLSLVIGLILVRHPIKGITAVAILLGVWMVAVGCVRTVRALQAHDHVALRVLAGVILLCAGIVLMAQPKIGYGGLALLAGISFALQGITLLALGFSLRGTEKTATAHVPPGVAAS
jgi:uncharacterized membrane protein HdeD (DUF308 family)